MALTLPHSPTYMHTDYLNMAKQTLLVVFYTCVHVDNGACNGPIASRIKSILLFIKVLCSQFT